MQLDKDLMIQLSDANEAAFRQIFDQYGEKVYRYILHYVKVRVVAEDITQNVFLRIWEKRGLLDPRKYFLDPNGKRIQRMEFLVQTLHDH